MVEHDLKRECLQFGCASHSCFKEDCKTCGFYREEAQRRKELPLIEDEDGIRRKIIRRKKNDGLPGNET